MDRLPSTHNTPRARVAGILLNLLLCAAALTLTQRAIAQDVPPPVTPAPVEAPAPAPTTTTPPVTEPVVTATPVAPPPPVEELPPAEPVVEAPPEAPKPLSIGAWAHLGTYLNGPDSKVNRVAADGELDLLFSADLIDGFGMTANLVGYYGPGATDGYGPHAGGINIMDLHGKITIDDAFNIWVGRMLVPSDRANFSGYWFAAPWFYPGQHFAGPPVGPRQGPQGRNDGITVWGQAAGGLFKYYAGAYNLQNTSGTALFSGRLNLSLLSPEPGYYHSSTYYGAKDVLAIGIGGQYQKDGSPAMEPDDYAEFNADILFEKNFGAGGVLDLEGAFYKYMGDGELVDHSFLVLASWMTAEKIGVGKIQPLVRFQSAKTTDVGSMTIPPDETSNIFEGQIGYVIDSYATRFALGFLYQKAGDAIEDTQLYLGLQLQK